MCRSFELTWGWQKQTASDTVHAVTALLDMTTAKQLAANDDAKDRFWYTCHLSKSVNYHKCSSQCVYQTVNLALAVSHN